jgi:hypothetical protein
MCELNHNQLGCKDRFEGESDSVYKRRIAMEQKLASHHPKVKQPADPFAGIPQADDSKW